MTDASFDNPSTNALMEKVLTGFKYISGSGWETRADYQHFWPLVRHLYKLAKGPKAELPMEDYASALGFMFAGHAGRVRKGIRPRPYFHHILKVLYLAWLMGLSDKNALAAIHHDDYEDIPEHLGVSEDWVERKIRWHSGTDALVTVLNLTNKQHPDGKHAGQLEKMAAIPLNDATLKLLDRIANLYDMRRDKPKNFTPERILQECRNALELADAMPTKAPPEVLAILHLSVNLLAKENNLTLA